MLSSDPLYKEVLISKACSGNGESYIFIGMLLSFETPYFVLKSVIHDDNHQMSKAMTSVCNGFQSILFY